jgi:hypothetical protein
MLLVFIASMKTKFPCCNWKEGIKARSKKMQLAGEKVDDKYLYLFLLENPEFEAHESVALKRLGRHLPAYVNAWYDADRSRGLSPYQRSKDRRQKF